MVTVLGKDIVNSAYSWYSQNCYEETANRGYCIDKIHQTYSTAWIQSHQREAYCAEFVSIVLKEAFSANGVKSPIYTASAAEVLKQGKKSGLLVDKNPAPGAVFYKFSSAKGASGHVGIVVAAENGQFTSIEGNAPDPQTGKEGVVSLIRNTEDVPGLQIIHTELALGNTLAVSQANFGWISVLLLAGIGAGQWYTKHRA